MALNKPSSSLKGVNYFGGASHFSFSADSLISLNEPLLL